VEWDYAENNTLVGHAADTPVFMTRNLPDKRVMLEFGNGGEGKIPPRGNEIKVQFFDTLGPKGHVLANEIINVNSSGLVPNNPEPSTGGKDFETIEVARNRYPEVFRTLRRAVTLRDWEVLSAEVPGVMQAKAVDINVDPKLPFFKVLIYVIGEGGIVSDSLNNSVREDLRNKRVNATVFDVVSPHRINVDVKGTVNVFRSYNQDEVLADVGATLSDFFEMTAEADSEIQVGKNVSFSRLVSRLQGVEGVESINLASPNADVTINPHEFAFLFTQDLTVGSVV
jgi:predicted phage baseplate assembly protein